MACKQRALVVHDDGEQCLINLDLRPPLYSINPSFLNLFMKKFTRRSRGSDHFRKRLLGDLRQDAMGMVDFAVPSEPHQRPRQSLPTRATGCSSTGKPSC
jgi:hypothetical protein